MQPSMAWRANADQVVGIVATGGTSEREVVQLQRLAGHPADLARKAVAALQAGMQAALGAQPPTPASPRREQQTVQIVQQPMEGQTGRCQANDRQQRRQHQSGQDQRPAVEQALTIVSLAVANVAPHSGGRRDAVAGDVRRYVIQVSQQAGSPGNQDHPSEARVEGERGCAGQDEVVARMHDAG